jgi:hypothetical protein
MAEMTREAAAAILESTDWSEDVAEQFELASQMGARE